MWLADGKHLPCLIDALDPVAEALRDHLRAPSSCGPIPNPQSLLPAVRECATLIASHAGLWDPTGSHNEQAESIASLCGAGLGRALQAAIGHAIPHTQRGTDAGRYLRPQELQEVLKRGSAFNTACESLVCAQQLQDVPHKDAIIEDCLTCVQVLLEVGGGRPEARALRPQAGIRDLQGPVQPHPVEISCLAAACHAGLVNTVAKWTILAPAAAHAPATGNEDEFTSAFGLACARAADRSLAKKHRAEGAECARLLVASGKVGPLDPISWCDPAAHSNWRQLAFEAVAAAGLTDITMAWSDQVKDQPNLLLRLVHRLATNVCEELGKDDGKS